MNRRKFLRLLGLSAVMAPVAKAVGENLSAKPSEIRAGKIHPGACEKPKPIGGPGTVYCIDVAIIPKGMSVEKWYSEFHQGRFHYSSGITGLSPRKMPDNFRQFFQIKMIGTNSPVDLSDGLWFYDADTGTVGNAKWSGFSDYNKAVAAQTEWPKEKYKDWFGEV